MPQKGPARVAAGPAFGGRTMRFLSRFAARERIELIGSAPQDNAREASAGENRASAWESCASRLYCATLSINNPPVFWLALSSLIFLWGNHSGLDAASSLPPEGVINGLQGWSAHFSYWPVYLVCTHRIKFDAAKCAAGG
jgi:hypothetical protein